jgi:hypothetical protein
MFLNLNTEVANQLASGIGVTGFEPAAAGGLAPLNTYFRFPRCVCLKPVEYFRP